MSTNDEMRSADMIKQTYPRRTLIGGVAAGVLFLLFFLGGASPAHAQTGTIYGTLQFLLTAGNFCPSSRDCTDAMYTQNAVAGVDQINTSAPIRNATVYALGPSGILGVAATDDSGNYAVSWGSDTGEVPYGIQVQPEHAAGRFAIHNSAGSTVGFVEYVTGQDGALVDAGTVQFGPDPFLNSYWAAELVWRLSLAFSPQMVANFTGLNIRGFANSIPGFLGSCGTSCADGELNRIQLDQNAAFSPQARIMHEMGHIVAYKEKTYKIAAKYARWVYCWPNTSGSGCGWTYNAGEWGVTSFEEAFATFVADTTLYFPNAVAPHTCLAAQGTACTTGQFNLETSSASGGVNNCGNLAAPTGPEKRWPLTLNRFLWDVYDAPNDSEAIAEGVSNYGRLLDVLSLYPTGTTYNDNNAPWNTAMTLVTKQDYRGAQSYLDNYVNNFGVSLTVPVQNNCNPF
jgi:hypothetical protein